MAEQEKSPLQREQQALQKPLGLKRPLSWIFFVPILFAFFVLPLVAMQAPVLFGFLSKGMYAWRITKMEIAHFTHEFFYFWV